ncbi:MAG: hypothetical protein LBN28_03090 [Desulfovibrio sp.]|jgi:hypothetical protein|nr:hypothetical protein [Desulfovibrio sp.]
MSNYKTRQKEYALTKRAELCSGDSGNGKFRRKEYPFVLQNASHNLFADICKDAIKYFNKQGIGFWCSSGKSDIEGEKLNLPTGHMLSSQVACINHLFKLRNDGHGATALLKGLDRNISEALLVNINDTDDSQGYVEFEAIGGGSYLNEGVMLKRGANCTSLDALMRGGTKSGAVVLFLIEWKYVEKYIYVQTKWTGDGGETRQKRYCSFFSKDGSPFTFCNNDCDEDFFKWLFCEPYYQLMRQTLLGWQMIHNGKANGNASEFQHIHVIPQHNHELLKKSQSKPGENISGLEDTWKSCLRERERYRIIDPKDLLAPLQQFESYAELLKYLEKRYWT